MATFGRYKRVSGKAARQTALPSQGLIADAVPNRNDTIMGWFDLRPRHSRNPSENYSGPNTVLRAKCWAAPNRYVRGCR